MQQTITQLFDDFDGSPAEETLRFGYDGKNYEIDLNEQHASEFDEFLAVYIERGRRAVTNGAVARLRGGKTQYRDTTTIRAWAREQGFEVSDRGRVSKEILAKYDAR